MIRVVKQFLIALNAVITF